VPVSLLAPPGSSDHIKTGFIASTPQTAFLLITYMIFFLENAEAVNI